MALASTSASVAFSNALRHPNRKIKCHPGLPMSLQHPHTQTAPRRLTCAASDDEDVRPLNSLEITIKRKSQQVQAQLEELGLEGLEERLQSAMQIPVAIQYRLTHVIQDNIPKGKCTFVVEISRGMAEAAGKSIAELAKDYVRFGANALAVRTDAEDTPEGLKDLYLVTQAVRVPVLRRDWIIHPIQVVEAKESGAAGVLGVIHQINGKGTSVLSSFCAALGLEAPVEVVNLQEVDMMDRAGVPFFAINLAVGLSISVPGASTQIAHGLLGKLPFGSVSLVGMKSLDEGRKARLSGADALFVKQEAIESAGGDVQKFLEQLEFLTNFDD